MNRKYIALTMAALMAIGIAGCGKKEEPAQDPTPTVAPTEAPATETPTPTVAPMAIYAFDGTNAEKAIVDYLANSYTRQDSSSVVIPHMEILKIENKEATVDVYGAFRVSEYKMNDTVITLVGGYNADSRFTLNKNSNGTFTVADSVEVKNFSDDKELTDLCAGDTDLLTAFKDQDKHDVAIQPWPAIRGNDFAYYAFDNNLTITGGTDGSQSNITIPKVIFSTSGAKNMYLTTDAYVRTAPDESGHAYYMLLSGAQVTVTGMTEVWARVTVEDRTGYIAATALTDTAPTGTPTPTPSPTPTPEPTATPVPAEPESHSSFGYVTEYYSDRIVIQFEDRTMQYKITADTGMTSDDIPINSAVTIEYTNDLDGQAVAKYITIESYPEEYVIVDVDDSDADDEIEVEVEPSDESYVEVEID